MKSKYQEALDRLLNDDYDFSHDFYEDDKATAMERDIDTLQELVDKAVPKKPFYEADGYDENGELIYDTWICPNCDKKYEVDYDEYDHCPNCGQAIDWSDEDVE